MNSLRNIGKTALALSLASLGSASHAAWDVVPEASLAALTDDNLRLVQDDLPVVPSDSFMSLDARLTATSTGERSSLFIEPRVRADQYSDPVNEDLNGTDQFLRARGAYDWEQVSLDFLLDYDVQDIKDAELTDALPDDPNIDDPTDPDTGLAFLDEDRQRVILRPSMDIRLSERSSLVLESELLDVSYSGAALAGRVDFQDTRLAAGIVRRVDARNEIAARVIASDYTADFNQNETKTFGVEGNFRRDLVRDWTFELVAGVSRSDYSFVDSQDQLIANADTSFTYGIGFRQRGERNTINIDLDRVTSPNSSGFLTLRDQLRLYVSRAMSERLRGEIGLRGYTTETLDDVVDNDQRDYFRVDLMLEWAITQRMYVNGGYAFTTQKFGDSSSDATSNNVYVGFTFRGLSRP